jgi:predicted PurR-regulated permease PerM
MEAVIPTPGVQRVIVGLMIGGLLLLGYMVLQDFVVPSIWAGILCYSTWAFYLRLTRWCRGNRTLAALLATLLMSAVLVVPMVGLAMLLQAEVAKASREVMAALDHPHSLPAYLQRLPLIGGWLTEFSQRLQNEPQALRTALQSLLNNSYGKLTAIAGDVGRNVIKLLITVFSLFFFYRDGDRLAAQVRGVLVKLVGARAHDYLDSIGRTVKAVLLSLVLCALAQSFLATLGYWAGGVPAPLAAGVVTLVAALIPFAIVVVWGSVVAWLYATGHVTAATALLVWCLTAVTWVDNLIRPLVIGGSARIPFLLVVFGVIGGIGAFGLVGMFIGPVILAVLLAIWREWHATNTDDAPAGG